jgi:hypothetical protein
MHYRYHGLARVPIDTVNLVADTGKVGDCRYYLRVAQWCFSDPYMQGDESPGRVQCEDCAEYGLR